VDPSIDPANISISISISMDAQKASAVGVCKQLASLYKTLPSEVLDKFSEQLGGREWTMRLDEAKFVSVSA
jgi:predicted nucleic acid-binding protein